ncbi:hypothetical protein AR457_37535 [Streptomyces agglomeratus]|nr:hypothetical protein AR457_37535 [Streptomyces agglomeratus]
MPLDIDEHGPDDWTFTYWLQFKVEVHNRLESPHFVLRKTEPACLGLSFKEVANPFPAFGRFKASHHPGLITGRCRQ